MTRQHAILWGSTLLISLSYGEASFAENKPLPPDADTAFAEADTDSNGRIDHVEFHQRMVEVFYFADRDRDGYLAGTEIEQTVTDVSDECGVIETDRGRYPFQGPKGNCRQQPAEDRMGQGTMSYFAIQPPTDGFAAPADVAVGVIQIRQQRCNGGNHQTPKM